MFHVDREPFFAVTHGLIASLGFELILDVSSEPDAVLLEAAENLARILGDHFLRSGRRLSAGETVEWASSLLTAREQSPGLFALDELALDGETLLRGVSQCTKIWAAQSNVCREFGSVFRAAKYGQKVACSPDALSTSGVIQGVRYASPDHMSGWWIFDEPYDGDVDEFRSMRPVPLYRVLAAQPRLAPLLALDTGYAFAISDSSTDARDAVRKVWFEEEIARRPIP